MRLALASASAPGTEAIAEGSRHGSWWAILVTVAGELGTGKTTFVRAACRALGVTGLVTDPTFTIGHRYSGDEVEISHLDLYRLASISDAEWADLGALARRRDRIRRVARGGSSAPAEAPPSRSRSSTRVGTGDVWSCGRPTASLLEGVE